MNDEFFSGLIGELEEQSYSDHPPERVLRRYLRWRLPDRDRFSEEITRLLADTRSEERWTLTAVSLHVATCRECAARVARIRAATNPAADPSRGRRNLNLHLRRWTLKRRLAYYLPLATAAAGLIVLLVNLLLFNPHSPAQNCIFGGLVR